MRMKIDSPKFAPAPRSAELPQVGAAVPRNTGIVPPTQRQPVGSSPTSTTGGQRVTPAGTTTVKAQVNMDFDLAPSLEPHRAVFAQVGAKIAKLPTEEQRTAAIDRTAFKLSKFLNAHPDLVKVGLKSSVEAQLRYGPTTTNDPQCYFKADVRLNASVSLKSKAGQLKAIGLAIASDSSIKNPGQVLKAARPQLDQLNLNGRDKAIAKQYLVDLVAEQRARTGGAINGGARPPQGGDTFQILPHKEPAFQILPHDQGDTFQILPHVEK